MPARKRKTKSKNTKRRNFGGRATARGVNYEVSVAAFIAVNMLGGKKCVLWAGITGHDIRAVTLQAADAVDDVVVTLRSAGDARAFVSAKHRSNPIPLTPASPAFADTVAAFISQFAKLAPDSLTGSRFVWAVPSTAGIAATTHLAEVLDAHRLEAADSSLVNFVSSRSPDARKAIEKLVLVAKAAWAQLGRANLTEKELRDFLRMMYVEIYDFGNGHHSERLAERELGTHVLSKTTQAHSTWTKLEYTFSRANESGLTLTSASLRQALAEQGLDLAIPPDYAADIKHLRALTDRNLARLKEHAALRFGTGPTNTVHIDRADELAAFVAATKDSDLLLTGEPGCGKSGLVYATCTFLKDNHVGLVLLLAEELFLGDGKHDETFLRLEHPIEEVLANWTGSQKGVVITDALDAVRDPETQKRIRALLRDIREGQSNWNVVTSVREFDLKHSRELREAFPGKGVPNHNSNEFTGVSHFHLAGLTDSELDWLGQQRPEIVAFLDSARGNPKSGSLHKSPFYLRLAAELLSAGVTSARLADWNSPATLLRKFWENRVEGIGVEQRFAALTSICGRMVNERSMILSLQELKLSTTELVAVSDLRSRGILQSPSLVFGAQVGGEEVRFSHHLLHDYAIARVHIPTVADRFCKFAVREPLLSIFYRQSFMFALEEIWDADNSRSNFWRTALELEGAANLHGLTRILAPIVAARRVEKLADIEPLLDALGESGNPDDSAQKALSHLASGLQDANAELIVAGAPAWCEFVERLGRLIDSRPLVEGPLTHILARLNGIGAVQ
jgi:hypothetical protein